MRQLLSTLLIITAIALLSGCAGQDFVRPTTDELKVGASSYAQVLAKMGAPRASGESMKNGETIKTITYAYATTVGEPLEPGVIPARVTSFFFHHDILVGQEFLSSFKSDNTNFDETKVPALIKGKTTRAEVAGLLGKPTAIFLKPVVKETAGEAFGYSYVATSGGAFSGFKHYKKVLHITFDQQDHVADVDFTTSGSR